MKTRKSPQRRKAESYRKDRRSGAEHPHAARKGKPRKKARGTRRVRREARQALSANTEFIDESVDDPAARLIDRKNRVYSMSIPLSEHVATQKAMRLFRVGSNFFRNRYDTKRDRARFAAFLQSVLHGKSGEAHELAALFATYLAPPTVLTGQQSTIWPGRVIPPAKRNHDWLEQFFKDEPAWRSRLRSWIRRMTQSSAEESR
jgi:hypothetical protein